MRSSVGSGSVEVHSSRLNAAASASSRMLSTRNTCAATRSKIVSVYRKSIRKKMPVSGAKLIVR